jgi:hypothetical protein
MVAIAIHLARRTGALRVFFKPLPLPYFDIRLK